MALREGRGSRVTNNIIHDVDYSGGDAAAIRALTSSLQLDHNTIYYAGRDGILHSGTGNKIIANTISYVGSADHRGGRNLHRSSERRRNRNRLQQDLRLPERGYGQTGLFFDNSSPNYNVHNNVVSDVDTALKMNGDSSYMNVWNNTLNGSWYAVFGDYRGGWYGTKFISNVFLRTATLGSGAYSSNNTSYNASGHGAAICQQRIHQLVIPTPTVSAPAPTPAPTPTPVTTPTPTPSTTTRSATQTSTLSSAMQCMA